MFSGYSKKFVGHYFLNLSFVNSADIEQQLTHFLMFWYEPKYFPYLFSVWASYSVEKWCKRVKRLQHSSLSLWIIWAVSGIPKEVPGTKGTITIL